MCLLRAKLCFATSRKSAVGKVSDDTKGVTMDGSVVGPDSQLVISSLAAMQRLSAGSGYIFSCQKLPSSPDGARRPCAAWATPEFHELERFE
jgi:hypothetical protein